ncbi:roadblock/LC7 domain-containing protein [Deinococcus misasensis]|jgi:uncharacterized protein|uniref:roadblock/LC7 domain-containing protein n=1 Tax=Deinococcus misasensis TaxID=392413 RepID=UPI000555E727|nr:roadblock/LC7 domain-containing protein [Deinococcus misasensis]
MSKQEQLQEAIDRLRTAIPELQGALVASTDGLPIAYSMGGNTDPVRIAAMAATALGLGKRIGETLSAGQLAETSVTGSNAQILIYAAGTKGVLAVIAPTWSSVGLIHLEARDVSRKIAEML